jgi:FkbM family methyltransferase
MDLKTIPIKIFMKLNSFGVPQEKRSAVKAFKESVATLQKSDIAIDCGANVGEFTRLMAKTGATVYAFEPNPIAYQELLKNTVNFPNVKAIQAAVTAEEGLVRLHLHEWADKDPLHWSTGSSLLSYKCNVLEDKFVEVKGVQLSKFIKDLNMPVRLLKMDIEGAEVELLNHLLDQELYRSINQAFVEIHDRKIPELVNPTNHLRERIKSIGIEHFRLDWH